MKTSEVWTQLTAIGTLAASVIALAVAVVRPRRRYWHRPKLEVRVGSVEPWARVAMSGGTWQAWLRVEVRNRGRDEATRVRAVIHAWYERADPTTSWQQHDLDPAALHWVSMPYVWEDAGVGQGAVRRETASAVNLPPGLSDFVDLIAYSRATRQTLVLDDQRPRGFTFQPVHSTGVFIAGITVAADNAKSVTRYVHYALSDEELYHDVRFEDGPPSDSYRVAILTAVQQLQRAQDESGAEQPGGA